MKADFHSALCNLNSAFKVPTRELAAAEADRLFGEQTFYAKVDTTLPEPKRKIWEKKTSNGDDE